MNKTLAWHRYTSVEYFKGHAKENLKLDYLDVKIADLEEKIADVKKRWPFHSVKPAQVQELEDLELQLEALQEQKKAQAE